jgi:hypothetical protein
MANESPISALPKRTQDLLLDHAACLQELKVLTTGASSNQNMPVGTDRNLGLVCGLPPNYLRFRIVLTIH